MNALVCLIPLSFGLGAVSLAAFLWSLRNGQYDDLEGAAHRVLVDEERPLQAQRRAAAAPRRAGSANHAGRS